MLTNNGLEEASVGAGCPITQREFWVQRGDMRIFCVLFIPEDADTAGVRPAVICSHILGGTHQSSGKYAREIAAWGYVTCAFDFCGGSDESRSTGKTTESSIKTEAADLNAVLDAIRAMPEVDERHVFLFGQSQGGAVSAMVAAERPDDVTALVLLYPAFVIHGLAVKMFGTPENAPETYSLWLELGHVYAVDAIEYDFYRHIGAFTRPVLMFQGTADKLEPKSYTDRAAEVYADVDYEVFEGVGHSFQSEVRQHVLNRVKAFLAKCVLSAE